MDSMIAEAMGLLGISGGGDSLILSPYSTGVPPQTFVYKERMVPELEILIDIDPKHWGVRYEESRSYEGTKVTFRPAGAAIGNARSGDRVFDQTRARAGGGSLCGFFRGANATSWALTCAHVVGAGATLMIDEPRKLWGKIPFGSQCRHLGKVSHREMSGPVRVVGGVQTRLDAALIATDEPQREIEVVRRAFLRPISTIFQGDPVQFRGAHSSISLARVAAVTVRKSIDLLKDGTLHDVWDVMMLGHRFPMYTARRVSRAGDSGAAVRQGFADQGPFLLLNQWHGMIIGGDDTGAFATHAEHLFAWASQATGDPSLEFDFES